MKIEQGSNLGIKGLRNLGIEGVPPADSGFSAAAGYRSGQFNRKRNYAILAAGRNSEPRISNFEGWKRFAKSFLKQTKYIHSTFDVRRSSVSFSIRPAVFWAGGGADS
jgi:hypothetical protein